MSAAVCMIDGLEIKDILRKLTEHIDLSFEEAYGVIAAIKDGSLSDVQISGFLVAFLMKGPTTEEIVAIAKAMRDHCERIQVDIPGRLIDTCGTGGGKGTFNISTAVAIIASAAGIPVAKHGSRSISSLSGSADVLEALGVEINLSPSEVKHLIEKVGIGFLYAPLFHPIMHRVLPPEQELGIKTIFYTIIGPLINPAGANAHIMGVYRRELVDVVAEVVKNLNFEHVLVVHGLDGLDEISLLGETYVAEVRAGQIKKYIIRPEDFNLKRCRLEDIKTDTPVKNAETIRRIFLKKEKGPRRDIVILNSAGALLVGGKAATLKEGIEMAEKVIDEGKAQAKLEELIIESQKLKAMAV